MTRGSFHEGSSRAMNRMPVMLRLLRLLAFAIVTIVCAGLTSPGLGLASGRGPIEIGAAGRAAPPIGWALRPQPSHQWRDGAAAPVVAPDPVEADGDDDNRNDDDERRSDVAHHSVVVDGARIPNRGSALHVAPSVDTSRFAIGEHLARGPPA